MYHVPKRFSPRWHPIPLIYNDEGPAGSGQSYSEDCRERIYMALPIGYLDHSPGTYSDYYYTLNELNSGNESTRIVYDNCLTRL